MRRKEQEPFVSAIRLDDDGQLDIEWFKKVNADRDAQRKAQEVAQAKQRKLEAYVYGPVRVAVAALSLLGTVKVVAAVARGEASRTTVDDEAIRSKERTATELKLGEIASDITGQDDLAVICDADLSIFEKTTENGFSYIVRGVYLDDGQTKSGKSSILLDSTYCEVIEYSPYFVLKEQEDDAVDLLADAVFSFSHEVGHATGINDEGDTNCAAVDLFPVVADKLGIAEVMAEYDPLVIAKSIGSAGYHDAGC